MAGCPQDTNTCYDEPSYLHDACVCVCDRECVRLVKQLGLPIEHIVLPTFAYEHKIFLGPFSRAFPEAKVWIAPRSARLPPLRSATARDMHIYSVSVA